MRPLDDLRDVERASVLKRGIAAATLTRGREGATFRYLPDYLESEGEPIATTLPLAVEPVVSPAGGALPPFFSGLLPEGRRLTALRQATKTSADDELTLLLAVGGDAVGDVQVIPEDEGESGAPEPLLQVESWDAVRFSGLPEARGQRGAIDRVGIPGVQDKISTAMIHLPVARRHERFILKLDPPEFPHLVQNEAFFLGAAHASGLDVPDWELVRDADGEPGLLVRRFDRVADAGGGPQALAQEDACQVLGRYPADKYRVTSEEVVAALSEVCQARPVAALTLIRQLAFAYLSCNGDAHAKNFSVRQLPSGEWRVTPAYDLPSSHPYGDTTMALPLNGRRKEDIGRRDFVELGQAVGVPERAVSRALDALRDAVDGWIDGIAELPFDSAVNRKLRRAIEYRRGRL